MNTQSASASRRAHGDQGFTLIEVMVVVLVIGILLAIGVPTYLGARSRAQDTAARSTLRSANTTAAVVYIDNATYRDATVPALRLAEPGLTWLYSTTASLDQDQVSVAATTDGTQWGGATRSDSGRCYYIRLRSNGGTLYGSSTTQPCTGTTALGVTSAEW